MRDINEMIKNLPDGILTTKELYEWGFTPYFINKAITTGIIERISRGKYQKNLLQQESVSFFKFANHIKKDHFEEAYHCLIVLLKEPEAHNYYNHYIIYILLLEEILEIDESIIKSDDYSLEVSEVLNNSYYRYFIKFREEVKNKKFEEALDAIKQFGIEEKKKAGINNISTIMFSKLTYIVADRYIKKKSVQQKLCMIFLDKFKNEYLNKNYEVALSFLKDALSHASSSEENIINKLIQLLNLRINIKNSKFLLCKKDLDYKCCGNSFKNMFDYALANEDYLGAYDYLKEWLLSEPNNKLLRLYKDILQKSLEDIIKNDTYFESEQINGEDQVELTDDLINNLVSKREYKKLKNIFESTSKDKWGNNYATIYYIIIDMERLFNKKELYVTEFDSYDKLQSDVKRFFKARNCKDYKKAYSYLKKCTESDIYFFETFYCLVEDIVWLEECNQLQTQIDSCIFQNQLLELESLEGLLCKKKQISEKSEGFIDSRYDDYALQLIETVKLAEEKNIDVSYFETFDYYEDDIVSNFFQALQAGDYISAAEFIFDDTWNDKTKCFPNKKYLILYKKLLSRLVKICNLNSSYAYQRKDFFYIEDTIGDLKYLSDLSQFKKLIFDCEDYVGAKEFYDDNLADVIIDENNKLILNMLLKMISVFQEKEVASLLKEYKSYLKSGDIENARHYLQMYDDAIRGTALDRWIDFYYKRTSDKEAEINNENFGEREKLYNNAKEFVAKKEYQNAIEIATQYIDLNPSLSAKGYLLRGKAYEYLRKYTEAENDYLKVIEYSHEPYAYFRLGKICFFQRRREDALKYLHEYEKRKTTSFITVGEMSTLRNIYHKLGDIGRYQKYCRQLEKKKKGYN